MKKALDFFLALWIASYIHGAFFLLLMFAYFNV